MAVLAGVWIEFRSARAGGSPGDETDSRRSRRFLGSAGSGNLLRGARAARGERIPFPATFGEAHRNIRKRAGKEHRIVLPALHDNARPGLPSDRGVSEIRRAGPAPFGTDRGTAAESSGRGLRYAGNLP